METPVNSHKSQNNEVPPMNDQPCSSDELFPTVKSFDSWLETEAMVHTFEQKGLSRREIEVLTWVARGKTNSVIGMILHISPRTVSKHLEHIYSKLGVECRTAAVVALLEIMQESEKSEQGMAHGEGFKTSRNRVLLVDDDAGNRMLLRSMFESYGYVCEEVEHGSKALTFLETASVDLVITDNRMPVLGGIKFLEQLSTTIVENIPPVIMFTGNVTHELQEQAFKAGAYAVIGKSSSMKELLLTAVQAIQHSSVSPPAHHHRTVIKSAI